MGAFPDEPELDALHDQWLDAQKRLIRAHEAEREAMASIVSTSPLDTEPTTFEDLLAIDDLVNERIEAEAAFAEIDQQYQSRARAYREEHGRNS